jgi:recombination protein RecT
MAANMNQVPTHRNTNALAVQQQTNTVRDLLIKAKPALEQALPRHLDVDRLLRIAMTALTKNPKLLACDQRTLLLAVMAAAQCGLEPNSYAQEAYLIPYGKEVQFMPSYRGLMKLARQSGQIASIEAHVVYRNESFSVSYGLEPSLKHEVIIDDAERGDFRLVYAVARY